MNFSFWNSISGQSAEILAVSRQISTYIQAKSPMRSYYFTVHCHSGHHRSDTTPHADTSHNTGDNTAATCPQHTSSYPGPIIVSVWSLQTLSQWIFFSYNPVVSSHVSSMNAVWCGCSMNGGEVMIGVGCTSEAPTVLRPGVSPPHPLYCCTAVLLS